MTFPLADQDLERRIVALEELMADVEVALTKFDQSVHSDGPVDIDVPVRSEKRACAVLKQWSSLQKKFDSVQHVGASALLSIFVDEFVARELNDLASLGEGSSGTREPEAYAEVDRDSDSPAFVRPINPLGELKARARGTHANFNGLPVEFSRDPVLARAFSTATYTLSTELACLLQCTELRAHQVMHQSVLLLASPRLEETHRQGLMTWGNTQELVDQSEGLPLERLKVFGDELAEYLAPSTGTRPIRSRTHVRRKAQHVREALHAEPLETRRARRTQGRNVCVTEECDGMATLTAYLPAESAHAIMNTVNDVARTLHREQQRAQRIPRSPASSPNPSDQGTPTPESPHLAPRTVSQIRADVLVDLLLNPTTLLSRAERDNVVSGIPSSDVTSEALSNDGGFSDPVTREAPPVVTGLQPKVFVTVSAETLAGLNDEHALLHDYGPIPADVARQLAAQAPTLYRLLVDPINGVVLDLERTRYRLDQETRDYLHHRSPTCQFPGCSRSARNTDIDHIQDWKDGGTSAPDNLQLLCRKHHNMKTHYGWTCTKNPDDTLTWLSPLGNSYTTEHTSRHLDPESNRGSIWVDNASSEDKQEWQEFRATLRENLNADITWPGRPSAAPSPVHQAVFAKLRAASQSQSGRTDRARLSEIS